MFRPPLAARGAAVLAGLAMAGCSVPTRTVTLPPPDPALASAADAVVVRSRFRGAPAAPDGVVRGAGAGAGVAMGGFTSDILNIGGGGGAGSIVVAAAFLVVGLPIAAAVGAGKARTAEEVDAAQAAFRSVAASPDLLPTLERRIADTARAGAAGRWGCVAAAATAQDAPCPEAAAPATLEITAAYAPRIEGQFDPDVSVAAMVEATLTGPSGASHEMRWRYDSEPQPYFALTANGGGGLRREMETMLDRLSAAVARDMLLDPRPASIEVWEGGVETGRWDGARVRPANAPVEERPGVVRRMHPGEAAPRALEHGHKAVVAGKRGFWKYCFIATVDGDPPFGFGALRPGPTLSAAVEPGAHVFGIRCGVAPHADTPPVEIAATVEAGKAYCADGESFRPMAAGETC